MAKCENCGSEKGGKTSTVVINRTTSAGFPKYLCRECFEMMQTALEGDFWLDK